MAIGRHNTPTTKRLHFATLLAMALAPEEVGLRIRQARLQKGWTHEELARQMDANLRTVQRWQTGDLPRLTTLMRLADVLGVPSSYFVEFEDRDEALRELSGQVAELAVVVRNLQAAVEERREAEAPAARTRRRAQPR